MGTVVIRRRKKHEAVQAIRDLEQRGYEVVYPLTEIASEGKVFDRDSSRQNRRKFVTNTFSSCWIAKLRRAEKW